MTRHSLGALLFGISSSGCYDATLDPEVSGVYACEDTRDCGLGLECVDSVCISAEELVGPVLEIQSPEPLTALVYGVDSTVSLIVRADNFILTNDANSSDPLSGYVDVYVDGVVQTTLTSGNIAEGIPVTQLPISPIAGLHHVRLAARHVDGSPFSTARSELNFPFWLDDGNEHIGIVDPAPTSRVFRSSLGAVRVEIASLNFTFVNPGFLSPDESPTDPAGYVSIYIDAQVPECLPDCPKTLPQYQAALYPAGLSRVNRLVADQAVVLPDQAGTVKLQVVAQDIVHQPYSRSGSETDFVFYSVPIQPVTAIE